MQTRHEGAESVRAQIQARMDSGVWPGGHRLPSEKALAVQFGITRYQVRLAMSALERAGYVRREQGRGSFVNQPVRSSTAAWPAVQEAAAMVFPRYQSGFARRIVDGFMEHMSEQGRAVLSYNFQRSAESQYHVLAEARRSGLHGMVAWLFDTSPATAELIAGLVQQRFPLVLVDRYLPGAPTDFVVSDNVDIGRRLTEALIAEGHRVIAHVTQYRENRSSIGDRLAGYREALRGAGLPWDSELVITLDDTPNGAARAVNAVLARRERPTAFSCLHDGAARDLMGELSRLGYRVPRDIALAAVCDEYENPKLPAGSFIIEQPGHAMGQRAAEMLLARMAEPGAPPRPCFMKAGAVLRTA